MNIQSFKFNSFPKVVKQTPVATNAIGFNGAFKNEKDLKDLDPRSFKYWQAFYKINEKETYENPATKKPDEKIKEYKQEIANRGLNIEIAYGIAYSSVDKVTGEISPIAKYVVDCILPNRNEDFKYSLQEEFQDYKSTYYFQTNQYKAIPMVLESLKDKDGHYSEDNLKAFKKIIKEQLKKDELDFKEISRITNLIKDEKGIIDKDLLSYAIQMRGHGYDSLKENIETLKPFSKEKRKDIFDFCNNLYDSDMNYQFFFLPAITSFCFDKEGNKIEDKAELVKSIIKTKQYAHYDDCSIFELCYNSKDFYEIYSKIDHNGPQEVVKESITAFLDENGEIPAHVKERMETFAYAAKDLTAFKTIYEKCQKENNEFDDELFENTITIIALANFYKLDTYNLACFNMANNSFQLEHMFFNSKLKNLDNTQKIIAHLERTCPDHKIPNLYKAYENIKASIYPETIFNPITQEAKNDVIQNIFHVNGEKEPLTDFEKTIKKAIPTLEKHYKGLPLTYPRKEFLQDLERICKQTPKAKEIIEEKTRIKLITDSNKHFVGYNGLLSLKDLDQNDEIEKEVYNKCNNFLYNNKVITDNEKLNKYLNYIIKAFPEFINIIGKKQHGTHDYTVDIHSLLVLAHSIEHPIYKNKLNKEDKITLILTTLLHDISKQENTVDKLHPEYSAKTTKGVVKKVFPNTKFAERIYDFISNHHYLETLSNANNKEQTSRRLAFAFRRPHDTYIAKTIAEADLKSVNEYFFDCYKDCLSADNLYNINHNIFKFNASGNAVFTTPIIYPKKASAKCTETIDGIDYTIINLHKIRENEDMGDYGFEKGLTKKDLRFLVHMTNNLENVDALAGSDIDDLLSETLISPDFNRTYGFREYGVFLSQKNTDIINMCRENQGSGNEKNVNSYTNFIFNDSTRENFRNELLRRLDIPCQKVKDKDFASFYSNVLSKTESLSQINPQEIYEIGEQEFTGEELIKALKLTQRTFLASDNHNEIIGYKPEIKGVIAKVDDPKKISKEVLNFAHRHNYPIVLI